MDGALGREAPLRRARDVDPSTDLPRRNQLDVALAAPGSNPSREAVFAIKKQNGRGITPAARVVVVRMHSGNGPHEEMDRRAIVCFDQATDDVEITDPVLRRVLHDYLAWATTTTMSATTRMRPTFRRGYGSLVSPGKDCRPERPTSHKPRLR